MRRILLIVVAISLACTGALMRIAAQGSIIINLNFEYVRQGGVGVITLSGPDMTGGVVAAFDRTYPFFPVTGGFAVLVAVPITTRIREHPLTLTIYRADGTSAIWESKIRVESGEFIREPGFVIPSDRFFLLDPEIQRNEDITLENIYSVITPERFWEGQFSVPMNAPTTSPFGSVRDFNDGSTRRHMGLDFRTNPGTPVLASASGRVVFARGLDIHGQNVIIDHGWGVFSNYAHLQEIYVVPGQYVLQGEVLGLSGNTGRSTGPHLHWEIAVNGVWVSPLTFIGIKLPT